MRRTTYSLGEIALFNPSIKLSKGTIAPYVAMESLLPFTRSVSTHIHKAYVGGTKFQDGDILMARITPSLENGKTSIYRASRHDGPFAFGSTEFIVVRGVPEKSRTDYLYYLLVSDEIRETAIASMTGSSGRQRVQLEVLQKHEIQLPSLPEQQAIAETLGALDDKIEGNVRVQQLVPELINAHVRQSIAELGGRQLSVSALGSFVNGGAFTKGASGTGRMVIRIADLNSGPGSSTVYNDIQVAPEKTAYPGDILMSWSGSLGVYVWNRNEALINQHIFKVIPHEFPNWLVFDRLNVAIDQFRAIAADKATTMGHIQRKHLDSTFVEIPAGNLDGLSKICGPLWERRNEALRESLRLAELRDTLLPALMSGRLSVSEADERIAEQAPLKNEEASHA